MLICKIQIAKEVAKSGLSKFQDLKMTASEKHILHHAHRILQFHILQDSCSAQTNLLPYIVHMNKKNQIRKKTKVNFDVDSKCPVL